MCELMLAWPAGVVFTLVQTSNLRSTAVLVYLVAVAHVDIARTVCMRVTAVGASLARCDSDARCVP